jgi:hypothetical protein
VRYVSHFLFLPSRLHRFNLAAGPLSYFSALASSSFCPSLPAIFSPLQCWSSTPAESSRFCSVGFHIALASIGVFGFSSFSPVFGSCPDTVREPTWFCVVLLLGRIRENSVREWIQSKLLTVKHVSGKINPSDIFTKEMRDGMHFRRLRDSFMSRLSDFVNASLLAVHHVRQSAPSPMLPAAAASQELRDVRSWRSASQPTGPPLRKTMPPLMLRNLNKGRRFRLLPRDFPRPGC